MISFKRCLYAQISYLFFAVAYNVYSLWLQNTTGETLYKDSEPMTSIALLVGLLVPVLGLGFSRKFLWYAVLNTPLMILLFQSGVMKHVLYYLNNDMARYSSTLAWTGAIAINTYGVLAGAVASWQALTMRKAEARK